MGYTVRLTLANPLLIWITPGWDWISRKRPRLDITWIQIIYVFNLFIVLLLIALIARRVGHIAIALILLYPCCHSLFQWLLNPLLRIGNSCCLNGAQYIQIFLTGWYSHFSVGELLSHAKLHLINTRVVNIASSKIVAGHLLILQIGLNLFINLVIVLF
jgi:hypothetical protein